MSKHAPHLLHWVTSRISYTMHVQNDRMVSCACGLPIIMGCGLTYHELFTGSRLSFRFRAGLERLLIRRVPRPLRHTCRFSCLVRSHPNPYSLSPRKIIKLTVMSTFSYGAGSGMFQIPPGNTPSETLLNDYTQTYFPIFLPPQPAGGVAAPAPSASP